MLIACPTCASEYRIDADRVGMEGRSVRCAACRETWFISPADVLAGRAAELDDAFGAADAETDADWAAAAATVRAASEPEGGPVVDNVPPRPRASRSRSAKGKAGAKGKADTKGRRGGLGLAGISPAAAAALAVLALVPLLCLARSSVVRAMPQAASLYARIGLPVNLRGLEIRDVAAFRNPAEDGRPAELVVEGDVVGVARGTTPVPALEVEVRDAAERPLRVLAAPAPRAALSEGETARFRARFPDPPAGGRGVELRFAAGAPRAPEGADAHR